MFGPVVHFGRRQSRGILLGLSPARLVAAGLALGALAGALFIDGTTGALLSAVVWLPALVAAFVSWRGRTVVEAVPVAAGFAARAVTGQTRYKARPSRPRPAGTMALPGDAAALRFHIDAESGAAMVHDPHRATLSAVVRVSHPAYVLLSPSDRAQRVAGWGRALAGLSATGTVAALQVLEATIPDPGEGVRDWWGGHGQPGGGWAADQYEALIAQTGTTSVTHRTTITLSLDLRAAARQVRASGRGLAGAAAVLRGDMGLLETSLRTAGLRVERWLGEADLAATVREAYDPAARMLPGDPGARLGLAGPVGVVESWDCLRHDSGWSTVLWISEWPRVEVPAHFLHPLIFAEVRRTLSIVALPLDTAAALRQIRREQVRQITEQTQRDRIGQITDYAAVAEAAETAERERALAQGHVDLAFSGFVTVTAHTKEQMEAAAAAVCRAGAQAGCELRRLVGQQAQAFAAAALPLGRGVY
jgi:hypothetical protein